MSVLPPGPKLSEDEQSFRWFARPLQWLEECAREYGPTFTLRFRAMAPHVVFSEPEPIHEIFAGDVTRFEAGGGNGILEPFLGANSLLLLDGEKYLRHRKQMLPAFAPAAVKALSAAVEAIARERVGSWKPEEVVALDTEMRAYSLDVILRVVFGADVAAAAALRPGLLKLLEAVGYGAPGAAAEEKGGGEAWRRYREQMEKVDGAIATAIAKRRATPQDDVLSALLALDDAEVRDELVTILIAGHETVATSLAWAFAHLLRSPGAVARVAEPPYLDAVVKETLRINPPIPVVSRRITVPMNLGGFALPAGVHVVPCAYLAHRRPEKFPEPDVFRPERFLDRQFTPSEYFPFGGGVRRCLGMGLAQLEMKTILAAAFSRWTFESPTTEAPHPVRRSVAIGPSPGPRALVLAR